MDAKSIGQNISRLRKKCGITQNELAEKIGVSDKAVSRWESGRGFPDTTLILPLCNILEITANELLSGKLLPTDKEYREISEKNLIEITKLYEKNTKNLLTTEWIIATFSIIILLASCLFFEFTNLPLAIKIVILCFGFITAFIGLYFCMLIEMKVGFYECGHCKENFIPKFSQIFLAMHFGRTRYMKCPKCGKKGWNKKVINKNKENQNND